MATMTEVEPLAHEWITDRGRQTCQRCWLIPGVNGEWGQPCVGPCEICREDVLGDMKCPDFKRQCVDCCGCHSE